MNKYSEVNKKETLLENVSFVSSGEDRKTSIEISKRWITLTLCLLLLSTIVGCVGLFIGFRRIETQEMKAFEEILKVVGERKHDAISKGNETVSVEDLAEQPKVRTKRSSTMRHLYCHEGGRTSFPLSDSKIEEGHDSIMREFDKQCQCKHGAGCWKRWDAPDNRYGCSSFFGPVMQGTHLVKSACAIHDMCYETARAQAECDNEFHHNFKQLCRETAMRYIASATVPVGGVAVLCAIPFLNLFTCLPAISTLPYQVVGSTIITGSTTNCGTMADIARFLVETHGGTHYEGYQCKEDEGDRECPHRG